MQKTRAIIVRGCDPVRAAFAKKNWEPMLGITIDTATSDKELFEKVKKNNYEVFAFAPGQCQLIEEGYIDAEKIKKVVQENQPDIKFLMIKHASDAIP